MSEGGQGPPCLSPGGGGELPQCPAPAPGNLQTPTERMSDSPPPPSPDARAHADQRDPKPSLRPCQEGPGHSQGGLAARLLTRGCPTQEARVSGGRGASQVSGEAGSGQKRSVPATMALKTWPKTRMFHCVLEAQGGHKPKAKSTVWSHEKRRGYIFTTFSL